MACKTKGCVGVDAERRFSLFEIECRHGSIGGTKPEIQDHSSRCLVADVGNGSNFHAWFRMLCRFNQAFRLQWK